MTKLLEKAFETARNLPDREQDSIAALILDELDEDHEWDKTFAASAEALARLAAEAVAEDRAGKARPLDPEKL